MEDRAAHQNLKRKGAGAVSVSWQDRTHTHTYTGVGSRGEDSAVCHRRHGGCAGEGRVPSLGRTDFGHSRQPWTENAPVTARCASPMTSMFCTAWAENAPVTRLPTILGTRDRARWRVLCPGGCRRAGQSTRVVCPHCQPVVDQCLPAFSVQARATALREGL